MKKPTLKWRRSHAWILILLPVFAGINYLYSRDTLMPIHSIELSGTFQNIDQQEVEAAVASFIGKGFFSLDIKAVQKTLGDRPWTESVSIRRIWPDRLKIVMIENKPVARWDSEHLLSDKGTVFLASTGDFANLPLVYSASDSAAQVLQLYYQLEARFTALDEQLSFLRKDSRGALDVGLDNGLSIKFGREDIERKINRFVAIYNQHIHPRRKQIQQLDLRYSNGFAVAWKSQALESRDEASLWRNNNV